MLENERREEHMKLIEERLRTLCQQRGLDWDAMSEAERQAFIDELVHEDRDENPAPCGV